MGSAKKFLPTNWDSFVKKLAASAIFFTIKSF